MVAHLDTIQQKGTPDIEFAVVGLLARLRVDQGEAGSAGEHLKALRKRFQRPGCQRFLPNLDEMLCRVATRGGDKRFWTG